MDKFKVHFFKEQSRDLDVQAIIAFFEVIEGFELEMDEASVRFIYTHPRLGYTARFLIMPKSQVRDIYRLNPKYLDLNFHLELPLVTPDYFAEHVFEIAKKLSEKFNFYIYQNYFEDVLPFKSDLLMKIFQLVKDKYLELNPRLFNEYHIVPKDKLYAVLRYTDDNLELQKFYQDLNTYVPYYHYLLDNENEVNFAIEWRDDTLTVIPPFIDYILFNNGEEVELIKYEEALDKIGKYLDEVPGFLRNTKVLPKKYKRRALRAMRRTKFSKVSKRFTKIDQMDLLD